MAEFDGYISQVDLLEVAASASEKIEQDSATGRLSGGMASSWHFAALQQALRGCR